MQIRHTGLVVVLASAIGVVWAQTQTATSSSTSKQGSGQASASASAGGSTSSGGSSRSGGSTAGFSMARPTHAILYSAGPHWKEGLPAVQQNLKPHADYMQGQMAKGALLLGGPWRDEPGGMAVLCCKSDEEAQAILENDPAVTMGVMKGELKAWTVYFQGPGPRPAKVGTGIRPPE